MMNVTRSTAVVTALTAFAFLATTAASAWAQTEEAPGVSRSNLLILLVFALVFIVVIAFRRSQKKYNKKK